ncbi:MAG: LPXTG cell wall anchor domain-containing protein [Lachnospiraceae bacterium]|nr:LPXTG cell wall anchor domain-containing protein [Lachnospiraceae bacterium]
MNAVVRGKETRSGNADTDKPNDGQTGDTTSPQTGDDSNIALWMALMLAAGAALTGTAVYSRKRKYSR